MGVLSGDYGNAYGHGESNYLSFLFSSQELILIHYSQELPTVTARKHTYLAHMPTFNIIIVQSIGQLKMAQAH